MPASIHGSFPGAAQVFAQIDVGHAAADPRGAGAVYIVLGILYENTMHPITILSTLPSAGIGATLALLIFGTPFSVIAMIGIILLIGIVKKNAIMMIDVAIHCSGARAWTREQAIHDAAVMRLRPIMMTTAAAVLGAMPLAIGIGQGASLRQPLGITVDRRLDLQPGVHPVHDTGDLPVLRPAAHQVRQVPATERLEGEPANGRSAVTLHCLHSCDLLPRSPAAWSGPNYSPAAARPCPAAKGAARRAGRQPPCGCRPQGRLVDGFSRSVARSSSSRRSRYPTRPCARTMPTICRRSPR